MESFRSDIPFKVIYYNYSEIREKDIEEWEDYEVYDNVQELLIDWDNAKVILKTNDRKVILDTEVTALNLDEQLNTTFKEYHTLLIPKKEEN